MSYQKTLCLARFNSFVTDSLGNVSIEYHKNGSDFIQRCFLSKNCFRPLDLKPGDLVLLERNEQYYVKKKSGEGRYSMPLVMSIYNNVNSLDSLNEIFNKCFGETLDIVFSTESKGSVRGM